MRAAEVLILLVALLHVASPAAAVATRGTAEAGSSLEGKKSKGSDASPSAAAEEREDTASFLELLEGRNSAEGKLGHREKKGGFRFRFPRIRIPNPIACQQTSWSGWSGCSNKCGKGTKTRTRKTTRNALFGGGCGSTKETTSCTGNQCPVNCAMHGWGGWSTCDRNCGGGNQKRTRGVRVHPQHGGAGCPSGTETRK